MPPSKRKCNSCSKEDDLKCCAQCKLVDYCSVTCQTNDWRAGHKILCKQVPKAIKEAKDKIASFNLSQYTLNDIGTFWVTEAQAQRGQIIEEEKAQDFCWDAMEMKNGSTEKLRKILEALRMFPLSTEGWRMLGSFYRLEVSQGRTKECSMEALKCSDIAIQCGLKLNPIWRKKREDLSWGQIENRPYLRALKERAIALYDVGRIEEAIQQAKKLMRLNPSDNQGIRQLLVSWYLETKNTEGCSNLLRKYKDYSDTHLAYADLLLQFLLWKKDDAVEDDVKKALFVAISQNSFVLDLITSGDIKEVKHEYITPGTINEAESYVDHSRRLWKKHYEAIEWIKVKRNDGGKVPDEMDLVQLLKSGATFQIHCKHTDLDGHDYRNVPLIGTQKRKKCAGRACEDFVWPRQLNQQHKRSADILIHHNIIRDTDVIGDDRNGWPYWRKTKYADVKEVPFWKIILQFCEDDLCDNESDSEIEDKEAVGVKPRKKRTITCFDCIECGETGKFCALCDEGATFFCSESCMNDKLIESGLNPEPLFYDLNSDTLKINALDECEIKHLDIDEALCVAADHMPNLKAVEIFIGQTFILSDDFSLGCYSQSSNNRLQLSAIAFMEFFNKVHTKLESFSLRVGDCCWDKMKKLTDNGRAFVSLVAMPNLKKLSLGGLSFDDITVLTSSLNPKLKFLELDNIKTKSETWCIPEVKALVGKISQLTELVTLSLSDHALTDVDLNFLLPHLTKLRSLNVSGRFGDSFETRHSMLTDKGLMTIAKYCSKLQSLDVSYNRNATTKGVKAVFMKCPDLLEVEASYLGISAQHVGELLSISKKILFFRFGSHEVPRSHEVYLLHDAIKASKGRILISNDITGLYEVNLSREFQRSRDDSMDKMTKAYQQESNVNIYNKWEGLV